MQLVDRASAVELISSMAPEWEWALKQIESDDGYVRFPPQLSQIITNLKIENYPLLYEKETSIGNTMMLAFIGPEAAEELNKKLEGATPEERGQLLEEVIEEIKEAFESIEFPKTLAEKRRSEEAFNALPESERQEAIKSMQRFWMAFFPAFYQSLSVMVHGEKLTSLVVQAKAGDDKAFAKAVQIDKRILTVIPYFKKRFEDAQTEGDGKFLEEVGAHLNRAPYRGRIRHKSLYMAFSLLEMAGWLYTMPRKELLDLCHDAGVGGYANRIEDEKNLSKRLAEYKKFQQRGMDLSTP